MLEVPINVDTTALDNGVFLANIFLISSHNDIL